MAAYIFVEIFSHNPKGLVDYSQSVAATIFAHGGRYHFRRSKVEVIESDLGCYNNEVPGTVLIEFPSADAAKAWYYSDEYQAILPGRLENSKANMLLIEGSINLPPGSAQLPE